MVGASERDQVQRQQRARAAEAETVRRTQGARGGQKVCCEPGGRSVESKLPVLSRWAAPANGGGRVEPPIGRVGWTRARVQRLSGRWTIRRRGAGRRSAASNAGVELHVLEGVRVERCTVERSRSADDQKAIRAESSRVIHGWPTRGCLRKVAQTATAASRLPHPRQRWRQQPREWCVRGRGHG